MFKSFALSISFLLLTPCVWGQFSSGFQGTVTDRSAGAVPGVTIKITNIDTGVSREVSSNSEGYYTVSSLGPGNYRVDASKQGFSTAIQDNLVLPPDQIRKVDFTLDVGEVRQSVSVSGQATVLETETGHVTSQMNQVALAALPVVNNSVFNLMALQPGVTGRSMGVDNLSGRSTANVNFAGARVDSNSYSMDGMSVNSISRGGAGDRVYRHEIGRAHV